MSSAAFILNIIFASIITLIFLYRCGNFRRQHPITTLAVFISWLFSALFIFVLPLDISKTVYLDCISNTSFADRTCSQIPKNESHPQPWSYIDSTAYRVLWNIVYWTSQVLTWLILPFMQSFGDTGEFSIKGKLKYTLKVNLIYYGTLVFIFVILLIILISTQSIDTSNLTAVLTAASTTWGLFLVVLLLGYGLVRMPLNIYNHSRASFTLGQIQFQLSQLYNEKIDVEEKLDSLIDELTKLCMQIKPTNPLRPYLNQIIKIVPERYSNRINLTVEDFENNRIVLTNHYADPELETQLVKLHERLKTNIHIHHRVQTYWEQRIDEAFYFEDINTNQINPERRFLRQTPFPSSWLRRKLFDHHPKLEWYTFCFLRPWTLRLCGISLGLISLMVIWSEMTFSVNKPVLSIFALVVKSAQFHYQYFTIEVFCCLSIAYMCLCAYYTMFRIRVFNYFYLSLYHLTDENSLVYAATFLSRLTAPLCYNFLGMIRMDQAITKDDKRHQTVFTDIMGHMTVIPVIADGFYVYFPILICLLGIGTFFRLGSRCLHAVGFRQFFDDDEQSAEYVEDGKALMRRERRNYGGMDTLSNTTTSVQRQERRRELEQKYGLRSASAMASNTKPPSRSENPETQPLMSESDETNNRDLLPEVYPQSTTYNAI